MLRFQQIDSFDRPELQPYRTMRRPLDHRQQGIFVAEGEKVVRRLLESDFAVVSVVLPEKWLSSFQPLLEARREDIDVYLAQKELLEQLIGFSMYQGVLAVGRIPAPRSLDDVLRCSPRPWLLVAVDALTNAENLGVLVRNCGAFGVHALLVGETSSSPFLRRAVRNSMGVIFRLPVLEPALLAQALMELRRRGVRCVAAHPHAERKTIAGTDLAADCCLVLGSEGYGISSPVLQTCDEAVAIPMSSGVDSLNVGSASAVFLYEASRQRGKM